MMPSRYLLRRIRLMSPVEVVRRTAELGLDHLRLARSRVLGPPGRDIGACAFRPFLVPAPVAVRERIWDDNPWHREALAALRRGEVYDRGRTLPISGGESWRRCPDSGRVLGLGLGRSFVFDKAYAQANMELLGTINRHYHLIHLAKAAALGHAKADEVLDLIEDWIEFNPYLRGVNWSDSLAPALRLVNWCICLGYVGAGTVSGAVATSVYQQARFVEQHLSYGSSAGNHILGELFGLAIVGACMPDLPRAGHWRELALSGLAREVGIQFAPDGLHREQSVSYHRYVLEHLLLLLIGMRNLQVPVDSGIEAVTLRAARALEELVSDRGEVARIGDHGHEIWNDFHYFAVRECNLYHSVLALAQAYFGPDRFNASTPASHREQRVPWFIDAPSSPNASSEPRRSRRFEDSGVYVLRAGSGRARAQVVFRCGPLGYLATAAHAHADMLSVVVSVAGVQLLIDPGTFHYHAGGPVWRQYFRGTRAHNTLEIGGEPQAVSGGAMIWMTRFAGVLEQWEERDDEVIARGYHDGYLRAPHHARHRRELRVRAADGRITIVDEVEAAEPVPAALHHHFHPQAEVVLGAGGELEVRREDTRATVRITAHDVAGSGAVDLVRGEEDPPLGWYSPHFGARVPAYCARLAGTMTGSSRIVTEIIALAP